MLETKIGIHLGSFRQSFKKALHTAARLGGAAVEIDARGEVKPQEMTRTAVRHLRKVLDDLNLRVCAVSFQTRRGYNVEEDLDARIEATKRAMQMAYDIGASVLINQVGRIPDEPEGLAWDLLVAALSDLGRFGQKVGCLLAAKTGAEDAESLARLLAALPPGSLGIDLDPGGLIINGFSPREALDKLGADVLHVHARDGVRDLAQGRGLEVPLGQGTADFPELMGMLEERTYRGYFTVQREQARDAEVEICQAVQYLKNI